MITWETNQQLSSSQSQNLPQTTRVIAKAPEIVKCQMSFALRCKKFDELESEARAGTLTIGKLFGSPESCTVLGQQQKNIEAFVYEHMSEIIAIAVGGLPCPNQAVVKGTYEFMSELPLSFKMRVGPKAHKVLEYLMKLVIEDRPYIPKHVLLE